MNEPESGGQQCDIDEIRMLIDELKCQFDEVAYRVSDIERAIREDGATIEEAGTPYNLEIKNFGSKDAIFGSSYIPVQFKKRSSATGVKSTLLPLPNPVLFSLLLMAFRDKKAVTVAWEDKNLGGLLGERSCITNVAYPKIEPLRQ